MTTIEPTSTTLETQDSEVKPARKAKRKAGFNFNSIGTKLFSFVMGSALVGLGSMSFFFYQELEKQAKNQIHAALTTEVNSIESKIEPVKQTARDIGASVKLLNRAGVKDPETYKSLLLEFFQRRPQLSMAAYFLQSPYSVVPTKQWYGPYFYADQQAQGQKGKYLPAPYIGTIYSELFQDDNYPKQDYYKIAAATLEETWMEPYLWYGITLTSFLHPSYDSEGKFIGLAAQDVNITNLSKEIRSSVMRDSGYFAVISRQGSLLSYPPNPAKAIARENYRTLPDFQAVFPNVREAQSGLVRAKGNFWAYERLPSTNWLMVAVVPESVVMGPVLAITVAGTLGAGLVMAIVVLLFVQFLNRKLQPILDECNKLAQTDAAPEAQLEKLDEIGRLSTSFYNLLAQVAAKEKQIRQESVARLAETQERLRLATEAQQEGEALQVEVVHILDVVCAIEAGDLTVEAQVSDRATGLVADTLNRLIEELSRIMFAVLSTAQQVTHNALKLEQQAVSVAQQAQQQAKSVSDVQALMVNFNHLSESTAQQAVVSDEAVVQAQVAITQGQQEISKMTFEIEVLQKGTEQIIKRAEMLTNFVSLAASFAKDQKRVAALTRVLALNASMIATNASQQDDPQQFASIAREFETVATQVNDLAVQTNQGLLLLQQRTDQIQTVVSGINQDVVEISNSVNQFIGSVNQSGHVFDHIKTLTDRVAEVGIQVTESSQAIASTAKSALQEIQHIAQVTAQTEHDSRTSREQAELIDQLATTLLEKVQFFRLSTDPSTINLPPDEYQQLSKEKTSVASD